MDIKAYIPIDNPRFVHLQYENYQAVISIDFGASLQHLSIDDYKLVHGLVDEGSLRESFYGSYAGAVLAPFANRIKNGRFRFENKDCFFSCNEAGINAIHGCVADKPFDVTELSSDPEKAWAVFDICIDPIEGFPFRYKCQVRYTLNNSGLMLEISVENKSDHNMPCFLGFHPYFSHPSIIDYCKLEFFPKKRYQLDNMIPNGELVDFTHENEPLGSTHYDDCFLIDTQDDGLTAVLTDTAHNVSTYIYTSDNVSHLQIYTPQGRHSIAIEPQLAPANIFNLLPDSKSLSPLATLSFWCKISAKLI